MRHPSTWHPAVRHVSVFGITLAAIGVSLFCAFFIEPSYFLPLIAAVAVCAWWFGPDGGIHATIVGAVMADFFLVRPRFSFAHSDRFTVVGLILFLAIAFFVTWLMSMLRESRDLRISILEGMSDALAVTDKRGAIIYMNPAAEALSGYPLSEARNQQFEAIFPLRDEATGERRSKIVAQALTSETRAQSGAHTILRSRDNTDYSVEELAAPTKGRDKRTNGAIVVLRNTTQRRQLQEQLTQSEKMQAIGRLAAGVAGDFNNLLTVITGFGELLTSEMAVGNPLRNFAEEILMAAERAAALSRQLLAFGKGQSIPAKPHDLNKLVGSMETMLRRVLGPAIEMVVLPSARASRIKTDPGQIEQIVVNLAMNARDAMPGGGRFVVETSDYEARPDTTGQSQGMQPGHYVMLTISDTGKGMDAETRTRLFEPFFTTKMEGRGSGLGLSIVYGIVQQHGGHLTVFSQPGAGTVFEIFFPRAKEIPETVAPRKGRGPRGTETILIADDEENVRKLVQHVLVASGYTVIEARDGKEALDLFEKNRDRVDMVLTDVVMPQMTGYELSQKIEQIDPARRIMFMSGFRDAQVSGEYENTRPYLNKPFTPEVLLKQVRDALDAHKDET